MPRRAHLISARELQLSVHGTATAATIWLTSAMGVAIGFGRLKTAIALSLINVAILRLLPHRRRQEKEGAKER